MNDGDSPRPEMQELRERAEVKLERETVETVNLAPAEVMNLVQELRTHQIELELQNEELNRAQVELEASRDRYADLYDFSPVGYVTINHKGMITQANLTLATMLGCERHHLKRQPFSAFIAPDHQDIFYKHRREVLRSELRQTCQLLLLQRDAESLWVELDSVLDESDTDGDPGLRTAVIDIAERKKVERTFQETFRDMERMNKLMVGREVRMIEMKREINALLIELGRDPRYASVVEND